MEKKKRKYSRTDRLILGIGFTILGLFVLSIAIPIIYVVLASFMDPTVLNNQGLSSDIKDWTLDAYRRVLENEMIWRGFLNSFLYSFVFTVISVFVIFSMGVTVFQYLVFTFLPGILGIGLAGTEFMWPKVSMNLFGVKFTWSLLGYNVLRDATGNILIGGGLGYFISYELGSFLAQCINFPLQRNITFKSHGNPVYQAIWYFVAWVVISLICNGFNNLWMPVAAAYVAPAVYNMLVTIITGGVSMVIFFFVFKIIFPEGKAESF